MKLKVKFLRLVMLCIVSVLLVGCSSKNNEDLFKSYSMNTPFDYMEMVYFYLDNLPYYLEGKTEDYYIFDKTGIEKEGNYKLILDATFENRDEKIRRLIPNYMLDLNVINTFGNGEDEQALYYKNKLYYLGDKMYLDSIGESDKDVDGETNPQKLVEKYLEAIKKADETFAYKYPNVKDYLNVLDYDYVDTKKELKYNDYYIIKKDELSDTFNFGEYESLESLKSSIENKIGLAVKLEEYSENYVKATSEREIKEFDLIYDLELTNQAGEKLYKKVLFNISNDNPQNILKIRYKMDLNN